MISVKNNGPRTFEAPNGIDVYSELELPGVVAEIFVYCRQRKVD